MNGVDLLVYIYIYIYIYIYEYRGLGGLVVIHSTACALGSGFNSTVAGSNLRFNSTLAGNKCWICSIRSIVDTCCLLLRLQTWRSLTNERSEAQLKTREGGLSTRLANLPTASRYIKPIISK